MGQEGVGILGVVVHRDSEKCWGEHAVSGPPSCGKKWRARLMSCSVRSGLGSLAVPKGRVPVCSESSSCGEDRALRMRLVV